MCGIYCLCTKAGTVNTEIFEYKICEENVKRRGPDSSSYKILHHNNFSFLFAVSVLWLQGRKIINQPLITDKSVFVYNGDIFGGTVIADEERKTLGDTLLFLKQLENGEHISLQLSCIQGPYSFIYLDKVKSKLYFGRDIFGRRSLLISQTENKLILTSVASKVAGVDFMEVPAIGIFCFDLQLQKYTLMPWKFRNNNFTVKLNELKEFLNVDIDKLQLLSLLENKLYVEPTMKELEVFENLKQLDTDRAFQNLLSLHTFLDNVIKFNSLLNNAILKRLSAQPSFCHNCILQEKVCTHALTGVLFSGGVDCTILALLADKYFDTERPIDLINVAFEKANNYETPDRITGLESLEELKQLRPNRDWNFVEINVTNVELELERENHIRHLIYPLNSILDDSLGCALWFASRAQNSIYKSPCRVLLVGMGADELFGGYTRHRAAWKKNGWLGLHNSLNEDWQNISHRNLARDDRVVSDHGRQLRTPYLDEELVDFARNLNCWEKTLPCDYLPQGFGEKILIRGLAYYLGLKKAAKFKKRALQFGSRIANSKENAHDISPRL